MGWDAADWDVIIPLLDEGKMPNFARIVEHGTIGKLATIEPSYSPSVWTSIATGKYPHKHGILGFSEPLPDCSGIRPVTNLSRTAKAVWNIFNQSGYSSNVVSWWPSHPAEPLNGVMVSNYFQHAVGSANEPWPLPPFTVHPERLCDSLAQFRVHPSEIGLADILPFVPHAKKVDLQMDKRIPALAKVLAECASVQAAATALIQLESWDFMAVYYDGIDHISHGFMKYNPPLLAGIPEEDFELYKGVVEMGYIFHDMMLGGLMTHIDENTTVMVVSDHGFESGELRPRHIPDEPAGPTVEHREFGIFAICGPGIKKDHLIVGSSVLDITPTLLHHAGLAVGEDMDGKVLSDIFEEDIEIQTVPSWETQPGGAGTHPVDSQRNVLEGHAAIQQLVDLGYISSPDEDTAVAVKETVDELNYNLAQYYMAASMYALAVPILEKLWEQSPAESRFCNKKMNCHVSLKQPHLAREAFNKMLANKKKYGLEAAKERVALEKSMSEKNPQEITLEEKVRLEKLWKQSRTNLSGMTYLNGWLLFSEGKNKEALIALEKADEKKVFNPVSLFIMRAECNFRLKEYLKAKEIFRKALEINPDNSEAYFGISRCYFQMHAYQEAAEAARESISLRYMHPRAHFLYGSAIFRCGEAKLAVDAFKVAVLQNPFMVGAYQRLALIYAGELKDKKWLLTTKV